MIDEYPLPLNYIQLLHIRIFKSKNKFHSKLFCLFEKTFIH